MLTQREWQATVHTCLHCGGEMQETTGRLVYELDGYSITVEDVPMKVCPACGEQYIPGPIAEEVSEIVADVNQMIQRDRSRNDERESHIGGVSVQYTEGRQPQAAFA